MTRLRRPVRTYLGALNGRRLLLRRDLTLQGFEVISWSWHEWWRGVLGGHFGFGRNKMLGY
jgi:hypothetical protein